MRTIEQSMLRCAAGQTPKILLALQGCESPDGALMRADWVCAGLGAELHVLRVLDPYPVLNASLRPFDVGDAMRASDELTDRRAATERWLEGVLGRKLKGQQVEVVRGDFVEATSERAHALPALMTAVAPSNHMLDPRIESITDLSGLPVLAARWNEESDPVLVAATDLEDERLPVLQAASDLAHELRATVVPVHNVSPLPVLLRCLLHPSRALREHESWADEIKVGRRSSLERAAGKLELGREGVVRIENDTAGFITQEARSRRADLVVVGLRGRGRLQRWLKPSVASYVVRDARRSVLVTPIAREP